MLTRARLLLEAVHRKSVVLSRTSFTLKNTNSPAQHMSNFAEGKMYVVVGFLLFFPQESNSKVSLLHNRVRHFFICFYGIVNEKSSLEKEPLRINFLYVFCKETNWKWSSAYLVHKIILRSLRTWSTRIGDRRRSLMTKREEMWDIRYKSSILSIILTRQA